MKRFWVSWLQDTDDFRPLTAPPNRSVIGWWRSGESDDFHVLCAVVDARNESEARDAILKDWPEALEQCDWRFFDARPLGWRPNDRFPLEGWMLERFGEATTEQQTFAGLIQVHWQKIGDCSKTEMVAQGGDFKTPEEMHEWIREVVDRRKDECPEGWEPMVCESSSDYFVRAMAST